MTIGPRSAGMVLLLILLLSVAACAGGDGERRVSVSGDPAADRRAALRADEEGGPPGTLYERLGGAKILVALVDDMADRVIADPRVNFKRRDVTTNMFGGEYDAWEPTEENIERFKRRMVEFLSLASGGPAEYSGGEMKSVHDGMRITNNEFDAMIGDIKASMDKLGIPAAEQRDLLAIIETTRKQIVEKS